MYSFEEALDFCKSKSNRDYNEEYFSICLKPTGQFSIGDYAIRSSEESKFKFRNKNKVCYLSNLSLNNFVSISYNWREFREIELLVDSKRLFRTKSQKTLVYLPEITVSPLINNFYDAFVCLPLMLVHKLDSDLLLPFSYLVRKVLDSIAEFNNSFTDASDEISYLKFLYTCYQTIDEIKNNCLELFFKGTDMDDVLIKEANNRTRLMAESEKLQVITSAFFKDFNSNFITEPKNGSD